eukprot:724136_1
MISHEKNEKNKDKNGEEHNITIDDDIDCGDAYNDTFIINYTLVYTATIPPNMPSTVQPSYCRRDAYIHTHHTTPYYPSQSMEKFLHKQHHTLPTIQSFIPIMYHKCR